MFKYGNNKFNKILKEFGYVELYKNNNHKFRNHIFKCKKIKIQIFINKYSKTKIYLIGDDIILKSPHIFNRRKKIKTTITNASEQLLLSGLGVFIQKTLTWSLK